MKTRMVWIAASLLFALLCGTATAELGVGGTGKFKDQTEAASSLLHDALADMQRFLGAIDIRKIPQASESKGAALKGLDKAILAYKQAAELGGDRKLRPVVSNPSDAADIQLFMELAPRYGIKLEDLTEVSVAFKVVDVVVQLRASLEAANEERLTKDIVQQQAFLKAMLQFQRFLNSVTTVFRTG